MRIFRKDYWDRKYWIMPDDAYLVRLFIPVLFGVGCAIYFGLHAEPSERLAGAIAWVAMLCGALAVAVKYRHSILKFRIFSFGFLSFGRRSEVAAQILFYVLVVAMLLCGGFYNGYRKANSTKTVMLGGAEQVYWVRAEVDKIEKDGKFWKLRLSNIDLWTPKEKSLPKQKTPTKINLTVRTKFDEKIEHGDRISTRAFIFKTPALPVIAGGYDYRLKAYFEGVGASGYSISEVKLFKAKTKSKLDNFKSFINDLRRVINLKIEAQITDKNNAGVMQAMITDERGGIEKTYNDKVRNSGVYHILSISGLHMTIAMVWVYTIIRILLIFAPAIGMNFDTKKFATIFAILFGGFYLLISGMPIPAVRSYLMLLIFFIAVYAERGSTPMFVVGISAFIILALEPQAVMNPSFQLSFAAVVALLWWYGDVYKKRGEPTENKNYLKSTFEGVRDLAVTSLVAGSATAVYGIYIFGTQAKYGLAANMIAVPAISFITLPCLFLGVLLMPFGMEGVWIKIAEIGMKFMNYAVERFGGAEDIWRVGMLPVEMVWGFSAGALVAVIFKGRVRWIGAGVASAALMWGLVADEMPIAVIDGNGKYFAVRSVEDGANGEDNSYSFYGRIGGFAKEQVKSKLGLYEIEKGKISEKCGVDFCEIKGEEFKIIISRTADKKYCLGNVALFVLEENFSCGDKGRDGGKVFDKSYLEKNGGVIILDKGGKLEVRSARDDAGWRIWNLR